MTVFIILLILNFIATVLFLLWGFVLHPAIRKERDDRLYDRRSYLFRAVVMLLCPVVGGLAFLIGFLAFKLFMSKEIDLAAVVFSKERVKTVSKGNEERDRNLVPLEEAIAVTNKNEMRSLMLNVIKGDYKRSLNSISLALNSSDSETAHYAASVLLDELNDFRAQVQTEFEAIKEATGKGQSEDKVDESLIKRCMRLIPYMNQMLSQNVFTEMEQDNFVRIMHETGQILYEKDKSRMDALSYENICARLLDVKEYLLAETWCQRLLEAYPSTLAAFTCRLKLYFTTHKKEEFFQVLRDLQDSNIIIDQETLELIRIFS